MSGRVPVSCGILRSINQGGRGEWACACELCVLWSNKRNGKNATLALSTVKLLDQQTKRGPVRER